MLGGAPRQDPGFLAQEIPLYRRFIPWTGPSAELSGGQQAPVALALILAKQPGCCS